MIPLTEAGATRVNDWLYPSRSAAVVLEYPELRFPPAGASDPHLRNFDDGLGVVALLRAATHFHDPACGVGEVVLILVAWAFFGRRGGFAGALFLGVAGGELFLRGGLLCDEALFDVRFHGLFGFLEVGDESLQPVLEGREVGGG